MLESKYINKIILFAIGMAILLSLWLCYLAQTAETRAMEYESKLFGDEILSIDIKVDEQEWKQTLEDPMKKEYMAGDVTINGETFTTVGVRTKGNSSISQVSSMEDSDRYSLQLKADYNIKGQTFYGLDVLAINNMVSDTTYMKDYLSYEIMDFLGVETPKKNYANVSVNGEYYGFCLVLERYSKSFLDRAYSTSAGQLYNVKLEMGGGDQGGGMEPLGKPSGQGGGMEPPGKPSDQGGGMEPPGKPSGQGGDMEQKAAPDGKKAMQDNGGSLLYKGDEISSYGSIFNNAVFKSSSDKDKKRVITAIKNLNEGKNLEKYFDVDEILAYFAAHNFLVNLDSYTSNMGQNYYIYEINGKIKILPWDYNLAFGGFNSASSDNVVNFPIDTAVSMVSMEDRPLLNKLLEVEEYKDRYHEYMQKLVDEYFQNGRFENTIITLDERIGAHVAADSKSFTSYEAYKKSLTELTKLGNLRAESVEGQLDGSIPSTSQGQRSDPAKLIDASNISLADLGSNMQRGGGKPPTRTGKLI